MPTNGEIVLHPYGRFYASLLWGLPLSSIKQEGLSLSCPWMLHSLHTAGLCFGNFFFLKVIDFCGFILVYMSYVWPCLCHSCVCACMCAETADEAVHRVQVLEKLADCCLSLGAYHIAAKKFTQAGHRIKVCC